MSLNPNCSDDHEIKIKGLEEIQVGDFPSSTLDLETSHGSLTPVDVAIVEAAQVKLAARDAKSKAKHTAKVVRANAKVKASCMFAKDADHSIKGLILTTYPTR